VPIVAVGLLADHLAAYWLTVPNEHERARELAASGHGWLDHAPLLLALCVAVVAAACALTAVSARGTTTWPRLPAAFALLPLAAYVLHEYVELAIGEETFAPHVAIGRTLLLGLALQIPLGVAALYLARALCSLSVTVGRALLDRRPVFARVSLAWARPDPSELPRIPVLASHRAGRSPPPISL
jgi:hypothetical protein